MKRGWIPLSLISILLVVCLGGCRKATSKPAEVFLLQIGIQNDGQPFFDWDEVVSYKTSTSGKVSWPTGAKINGDFRKANWGGELILEATLTDRKNSTFVVDGKLVTPVPIKLEFLGTAANETGTDLFLEFQAGQHDLHFEGSLNFLYNKPRNETAKK